MFCTDCGTRNSADSKYCKECGHKINDGYRTMMLSIEDVQAVQNEQNQERLTKLLDMAFWHNQAGNLDAAVLACEAALMIHPNCTTAHSLLGSLYEKKEDDAKAIEHFEAVVRLNPDSAADAAKLDQIRRGVHVKAVQPPPAYKWLPPALVSLNWGKWKPDFGALNLNAVSRPAWPERLPRPNPLVVAGAVGGCVLVAGLVALHPMTPGDPAIHRAPPQQMGTIGPYAVPPGPASAAALALPPPVVLKTGPNGTTQALTPFGPDPFGETLKPGTKTVPLLPAKRPSHPLRVASQGAGKSLKLSLPPLSLRAIPLDHDGGLAPAPISVPSAAALPPVPQHTVVVSNLGSAPYVPVQTVTASVPPRSQYGAPASDLSSHIHISINNSPTDNSVTISDHDDPRPAVRRPDTSGGTDGDAYQQTALSLQQQGDFRRARAAYQQAIRAYKSQIAAGRDTDAASQGLAASQTGLQICEQSR